MYIGTDKSIDGRKISRLVGKYEGFLNSAVESYEAGEALDWIAFFNQPWADFLCYDAFDTLEKELRHRFEGSAAIGPLLGNVLNNALCTPYDIVVVGNHNINFV